MKPILLFLALLQIQTLPMNAQNWSFAKRYSAPVGGYIENTSVAIAPDGSTFAVGNFKGTINFDTVSISSPIGATDNYGFLLKLDTVLQPLWARAFPLRTYDVTIDEQGNAFVAGSQLASGDDSLAYVAKYAPDGSLLASFSSTGTADCWAKVVRTDAAGNCYIAGERFSAGVATFGTFTLPNVNSRQCFLVKLSPDLSQVLWATYTGASSNLDNIYDLEIDNSGFVYTSGNYSQNFSFGCFCYNGSFFTEKHNAATGVSVWKKIFSNGSGDATKQLLSLDSSGMSVFVSASFKNTTTFQTGISLTAASNDDYHIYLAKMSASDGDVQWAEKIALTGDSYLTKMSRQGEELFLNGYFFSPVLMGDTLLNPQFSDAFLVETASSDGTVAFAEGFSGASVEYGYGLDTRDSVLVVSGNSSSSNFSIGNFSLPGSANSIYIARRGNAPHLLLPTASFTANFTNGCAPLNVQFASTSTGNPSAYNWQFPGGTPASSTDPNPMVTYNSPGSYSVTLSVSNAAGTNTASQTDFITVNAPPSAAFTSSLNALNASFANSSTNASSYLWDFGDGQTSSQQNPAHTYANCGTYTVTLTSTNICGSASSTASVTIGNGTPTANFTSNVNGLAVTFSNSSTNASSYFWDFGDGQTSSQQNPAHTYADCGTYTVTLTSTNICGSTSSTASVTAVGIAPTAAFTTSINGLQVMFVNSSTAGVSYLWDFGDGQTSPLFTPFPHTYADSGSYTVTLIVTNACGADTFQQSVTTMACQPPIADFVATPLEICAGEQVQFTSTASNASMLLWAFPGGNITASGDPAPTITYSEPGQYSVVLNAVNECGNVQEIKMDYITVLPLPAAGFEASANGLTVVFDNLSEDAVSYNWNFGDPASGGNTSTEENPTHIFSASGTYIVTLTAVNDCDSITFSMEIMVTTVGINSPEWLESFRLFPNPNTGVFGVEAKGDWSGEVAVSIFNPTGQMIHNETIASQMESIARSFDLGNVPPGVYWLRLSAGGESWAQKVVVTR